MIILREVDILVSFLAGFQVVRSKRGSELNASVVLILVIRSFKEKVANGWVVRNVLSIDFGPIV